MLYYTFFTAVNGLIILGTSHADFTTSEQHLAMFPSAAEILLCPVTELWFPQLPIQHDRCLLLCSASFCTVLQLLLLLLYFCSRSCNKRCTMLAPQSVRLIAGHMMLSSYVSSTHCPKQEFATCVGVCHNIMLTVAKEIEGMV